MRPELFAHRGFSARRPEMTLGAYREAIAWSARTGVRLGLECDVHFSADDQLVCLHDLDVDRTSAQTGPAFARTVAELKQIDFGARKFHGSDADDRTLVTLDELLDLVAAARQAGIAVEVAIETKHPNPRGLQVEARVARQLTARGWAGPGSPCRVISFSPAGISLIGQLLPPIRRTFLIKEDLTPITGGVLPPGVDVVGADIALLHEQPGFVAQVRDRGHQVHVWTVNSVADVELCLALGVTGLTTDDPELVRAAVQDLGLGLD